MQRVQAKKVLSAFRQGSSWPVMVDTGARRVFTKLHAAAHGTAPIVAEIVVGSWRMRLALRRRRAVWWR